MESREYCTAPNPERREPIESALYLAIVEDAQYAIIASGLDGIVIAWNSGATRIFGYTADQMIGSPTSRLFPTDRLHEELELSAQIAHGQKIPQFVARRLRRSAPPIDLSITISPVRDAAGKIVAMSQIAREVGGAIQGVRCADANPALTEHLLRLARSEQRFQTLVGLTSQIIWTNSPEGRMEGAQSGWSAFTGQSFDDYQGFGWSAAVHPDDAQSTIDEWNRCVAERRPFLFEHRVRRHDGAYRTCTINAAPVINDNGSIREWVGVHNDITERRQQEDELRAQEAKFRSLAESLPQMVWAARPDGWLDYFNRRWFDYTGMTLEQTQGWGWAPLLHPDDLQTCRRAWSHSVATGESLEVEHRFRRASDETYRWHLCRAVPLRDADGAIVKWLGTSTDIDDYKKSEARNLALQADLENRVQQRTVDLERVGKIAGLGGWSVIVASGALELSEEARRILDLPPGRQPTFDEAIGMYVPDARSVIEAACRHCMANSESFDLESQLTTANGRDIWVRTVGEARLEEGTVVRIIGALQEITTRKRAEQELFDHHELLRVTLDSIGDAVITTDAQGNVKSLNPTAAQLTGWTVGESCGLPVEQVFEVKEAQTQQRTLESIGRALSHPRPAATGIHTMLTVRDGADLDIEYSVAPIRDKTGQVAGSVLMFRDVSDRLRAAHALRSVNERFALAADAAGIGVWEWDLSANMIRWDAHMYRLYGRVPTECAEPYSQWTTRLHPDDRERAEREINESRRDNANFNTEFRIVLPGGEIRHLRAAAQIQTDAAGVAIRMIGVNFDVTSRKLAEMELKQTSSLLSMVLDSASDLAILATTPDLTIRVFNKGAERLLGYAASDLIGTATPMAFHDAAEVEARGCELSTLLGRSVHGGGVFTDPATLGAPGRWTFIRKDQRRVPVSLTVSAMFDDSLTLSGYMGFARDITQDREHERSLQEAKTQAERANAAKSEFLANMSHEIRTPLNAIIGLGYLLEQTHLSEEQRSSLREITFAGSSLLSIINNVLDISKIEAGKMLLEDAELDLTHLVQGVGQMLTPLAEAKGLALLVHCAADLPSRVRGDATRLGQIATNLLNNAIKFTEKGRVELTLSCSKPTVDSIAVRLSVRDTGIGIEAEGLARLFRPFSQADTSTTRRFGGTGLGLSIAARFVNLMGGEIGVTSKVGFGSEFWAEIPLRMADAGIPRALQATPASSGDTLPLAEVRVLVVDDNQVNLKVAQHILSRLGATVTTSGTGAEALERLRLTPDGYDVVLMDVQMPDMDGNEATQRIRTELQLKALPIIALTAGALSSERERSLEAGMNDFLTKPFEPAVLIGVLRRHLDQQPTRAAGLAAEARNPLPG